MKRTRDRFVAVLLVVILLLSGCLGIGVNRLSDSPTPGSLEAYTVESGAVEPPPANVTVSDASAVTDNPDVKRVLDQAVENGAGVVDLSGEEMEAATSELETIPHAESGSWYVEYRNTTIRIDRLVHL